MEAAIDRIMQTYDMLANRTAAASEEARAKVTSYLTTLMEAGENRPPASTEACSIAETTSRSAAGPAPRRMPGVSASALASVPPDVKTTLRGSAPTAFATVARASSTSLRA